MMKMMCNSMFHEYDEYDEDDTIFAHCALQSSRLVAVHDCDNDGGDGYDDG